MLRFLVLFLLCLSGSISSAGELGPSSVDTMHSDSSQANAGKRSTSHLVNIAVLPFSGNSAMSENDLGAIAGRFESEMMRTGVFRVLERRNVDAILREQGFQQSGACNTSECQVEVGQMLGVERIVTGEVSHMGKLWSLSVRMVDVGSGTVIKIHVLDIKGSLETVLRGGCPEMADILAGKTTPSDTRTVLAEENDRTWVWILAGAVVAGGGAALTVALLNQDGGSTTAATPNRAVTLTW